MTWYKTKKMYPLSGNHKQKIALTEITITNLIIW